MKCYHIFLLLLMLFSLSIGAQELRQRLSLPRLDQLSSDRVLMVIQDSEGFLWYATEGGGLCRDDGRQIIVFRSNAEHPDLLGSNDVASVAEAAGRYLIIGTFHGAFVLDKRDYNIRRLAEVDDKKVDDVIVNRKNGHWWLTANKKIFEFSAEGKWLHTYNAKEKYIARLHEDRQGRIWATEWDGGLLMLKDTNFGSMPWPVDAAPTSIEDDADGKALLIGTLGRGVVHYMPDSGTIEQKEPSDSVCMSRFSTDLQGRLLVANGFGKCYALSNDEQKPWYNGQVLTKSMADGIRDSLKLSARPTAIATDGKCNLWFSTGKDIRRHQHDEEEIVLPDTKDVSAMTFTQDGTLWLATIFGTIMTYRNGLLATDAYASNEYGDAVVRLDTDSVGRIVIVCDRYVRLYDPVRRTLRQKSIEDDGVYCVELQETGSGKRWSQPKEDVVERMPQWAWWLLAMLLFGFISLLAYVGFLHRQRKRFVEAMKRLPAHEQASSNHQDEEIVAPSVQRQEQADDPVKDGWLHKAIAVVEAHLSDEHYSVEQLSADMCMSRMTFYRKIQTATGQKPTEFIRTIRLRRAAELLCQGHLTITEISYETGFSSVSYFSRCFRTMFGVPPMLYGKTTTAEVLTPNEMPS